MDMTTAQQLNNVGGLISDNNNLIEAPPHDYDQLNGRTAPPDLSNILNLKRSDSYFMSDELRYIFVFYF